MLNKKILVTGSRGYIGKNLCHHLLNDGFDVIQCDRKIKKDVINLKIKDLEKCDYVIHLAACPSISFCEENINEAISNNIFNSFQLIDKCVELKKPIIFASSIAAQNPKTSNYAFSKYIVERKILKEIKNIGINLRFSNVYGGIDYLTEKTSVISNFVNKLNNNETCIINGDGNQKRDFIHVDEICRIILLFLNHSFYSNIYDHINIGSGNSYSINELINKMLEIKGKKDTFFNKESFKYNKNNNSGVYTSNVDSSILLKLIEQWQNINYLNKNEKILLPQDLLNDYLIDVLK